MWRTVVLRADFVFPELLQERPDFKEHTRTLPGSEFVSEISLLQMPFAKNGSEKWRQGVSAEGNDKIRVEILEGTQNLGLRRVAELLLHSDAHSCGLIEHDDRMVDAAPEHRADLGRLQEQTRVRSSKQECKRCRTDRLAEK